MAPGPKHFPSGSLCESQEAVSGPFAHRSWKMGLVFREVPFGELGPGGGPHSLTPGAEAR